MKMNKMCVKEEMMSLSPQSESSDSELENQPPTPESPMTSTMTSTSTHTRQHTSVNQCAMKIKQEITTDEEVSQSQDQKKCDNSNNNHSNIAHHNSAKCVNTINNNYTHKTKIARQVLAVIRNGDYEELLIILKSKPDLNVFINGQTALHSCLLSGRDVSWCRQLILNGANPTLSNLDGWQPLHLAAFNGLHESLKYLITCNNKAFNDDGF